MKTIDFTKIQAAGNDFIVIDNRKKTLAPQNYSGLAKKLCVRKFSIGADGLMLVESSKTHDFKMVIINSDGSEAEMCGNGARCIAYFARLNGITGNKMSFETLAGTINAVVSGKNVKVNLPEPKNLKLDFTIKLENRSLEVSHINTGVPHAIAMSSDIKGIDVNTLGRAIRNHGEFAPAGTNVDFVQVLGEHKIQVRTYERGVEAETYACGTGVVASAIIASIKGRVSPPVECLTSGGEILKVYFRKAQENNLLIPMYDIYLEGQVEPIYTGKISA